MKDGFEGYATGGYTTPGKLIGLGGELRAGKDEAADRLVEKHGYVKMGMSDVLNEALLKLNPWIEVPGGREEFSILKRYSEFHDAVGYVEAKKNPEVRRLLQVLGTEVGRDMIDPDVWVNMAEARIRNYWARGKDVVITAMRFPNELEMLKRLGGHSVWIDRSASERLESFGEVDTPGKGVEGAESGTEGATVGITGHASETSVNADMFTWTLTNEGTLDELYTKVDKFAELLNVRDRVYPEKVQKYREASTFYREGFAPPYDR